MNSLYIPVFIKYSMLQKQTRQYLQNHRHGVTREYPPILVIQNLQMGRNGDLNLQIKKIDFILKTHSPMSIYMWQKINIQMIWITEKLHWAQTQRDLHINGLYKIKLDLISTSKVMNTLQSTCRRLLQISTSDTRLNINYKKYSLNN